MAKDDYFVIVYKLLAYLYYCLKKGIEIDVNVISQDSKYFNGISEKYWAYILYNTIQEGYITGVYFADLDNINIPLVLKYDDCMITPKGIEYFEDNSKMNKVKNLLKDCKDIIPWI